MSNRTDNTTGTSRRNFLRRFLGSIPAVAVGSQIACDSDKSQKENPYEYDLTKLKKVDPKWLTYEEASAILVGAETLHGLAVDSERRLYVAGDSNLFVLQPDGAEQSRFDLNEPARCISVASDGNIILGMIDHVEVYERDGKRRARWEPLDRNALITSVAATDRDVFVADAGNKIVLRYDREGNLVRRIGEKDASQGIDGFLIPSPYFDLAIGHEGLLWVVNPGRYRLENYTFEGRLQSSWGKPSWRLEGFCGCCNPTHIAVFSDGRFVTSEKGMPRIKVYDQMGHLQAVVAAPDQFNENTVGLDLAVDTSGRVFVLDPARHAVRIFQLKT